MTTMEKKKEKKKSGKLEKINSYEDKLRECSHLAHQEKDTGYGLGRKRVVTVIQSSLLIVLVVKLFSRTQSYKLSCKKIELTVYSKSLPLYNTETLPKFKIFDGSLFNSGVCVSIFHHTVTYQDITTP